MSDTTAERYLQLFADAYDGTKYQPPHSVYQFDTSNIHQTGKTSFTMRSAEITLERLKGWKFDPDNIAFTIGQFQERRKMIHKYDQQILDEPQQVAGNRTWQAQPQQLLAEDLQTTNRYIKPAYFPTPHSHTIDNAIFGICTSQAVVEYLAHVALYSLERDQLNRSYKTRTRLLGRMTFDKPSSELWLEYNKRFDAFYEEKQKQHLEIVKGMEHQAERTPSVLTVDDLESIINADPSAYVGKDGRVSVSKVRDKHKVPYNRAQEAAGRVNSQAEHREGTEQVENDVS